MAFVILYRHQEPVAQARREVVIACLCTAAVYFLMWKSGLSPAVAYITALVIGVLIRRAEPRRTRYISARAKRQAIAKFEKETGETFNKRIHEFDHVLAHSRGGGNA